VPKAKAHPDQMPFDFEAPAPRKGRAELAGLERRINETVGSMLNSDDRPREVIAAEMSVLLDEPISRAMLDAYSSPARVEHRVPMSRLLALAVVTARQDLLRPILREVGMEALMGNEVKLARLGQIDARIRELQAEKRGLSSTTTPMERNS